MLEINYKKKYLELRSKYIADLDMAFRLGMEQGQQQAQQQQALEAQAQAQEMEQQQKLAEAGGMGGDQPGQPGQEGGQPPQEGQPGQEGQEAQPGMENPNGSELDQHINKLEGMLGSAGQENPDIQKSLEAMKTLRKAEKFAQEMKKSDMAIKGIASALHKPSFKIGAQAQHNMTNNAKKAVTMQHKIVNDIMKAWKTEEIKASNDIKNILNVENLIKE